MYIEKEMHNGVYMLPQMFYMPEGKEVAGRTPDRIHGSTYRGGQSYLRRIKGMVWKERASAEEVFQYQRHAL